MSTNKLWYAVMTACGKPQPEELSPNRAPPRNSISIYEKARILNLVGKEKQQNLIKGNKGGKPDKGKGKGKRGCASDGKKGWVPISPTLSDDRSKRRNAEWDNWYVLTGGSFARYHKGQGPRPMRNAGRVLPLVLREHYHSSVTTNAKNDDKTKTSYKKSQ